MAGRYDDGSSDAGFMAMILNRQQPQPGPSSTAAVEGPQAAREENQQGPTWRRGHALYHSTHWCQEKRLPPFWHRKIS